MNTSEPAHLMQQSYWRLGDSDTHFMIREFTVRVKQKLNFRRFPFDRQAINVVIESNNCQAVRAVNELVSGTPGVKLTCFPKISALRLCIPRTILVDHVRKESHSIFEQLLPSTWFTAMHLKFDYLMSPC
jgi:hypothetical protein